jgi:hypothetical protein
MLDLRAWSQAVPATNVVPLTTHRDQRLIDEMALALLDVEKLGNDSACILHLIQAGFRGKDIGAHLDAARDLARNAIAVP